MRFLVPFIFLAACQPVAEDLFINNDSGSKPTLEYDGFKPIDTPWQAKEQCAVQSESVFCK